MLKMVKRLGLDSFFLYVFLAALFFLPLCNKVYISLFHYKNLPIDILLLGFGTLLFFYPSFRKGLKSIEGLALILFLVWCRFSAFLTKDLLWKDYITIFTTGLAVLLLYLGQVLDLKDSYRRDLRVILTAVFIFGLFQALLAIYQYFAQHSLGLLFLKEAPMRRFSYSPMPGGRKWIFDFFLTAPASLFVYKPQGLFGHPNILSGFLVFTTILSYPLFLMAEGKLKKIFGIGIFLQIFSIFITFSRAGIDAWLLASALFMIGIYFSQKTFLKSLFLLLFFSTAVCSLLFWEQLMAKGGVTSYLVIGKKQDAQRLELQKSAVEISKTALVQGVGIGQYEKEAKKALVVDKMIVHNIYLLVLSELGVVGFLLFATFIIVIFYKGVTRWKDPFTLLLVALVAAILLIGLVDHYPRTHYSGRMIFFSSLALLSCALRHEKFFVVKEGKKNASSLSV